MDNILCTELNSQNRLVGQLVAEFAITDISTATSKQRDSSPLAHPSEARRQNFGEPLGKELCSHQQWQEKIFLDHKARSSRGVSSGARSEHSALSLALLFNEQTENNPRGCYGSLLAHDTCNYLTIH